MVSRGGSTAKLQLDWPLILFFVLVYAIAWGADFYPDVAVGGRSGRGAGLEKQPLRLIFRQE